MLEQIGVVFEPAVELRVLPHFQSQVKLGDAGLKIHLLDAESGNLEDLLGNVLEDEHHLEQRRRIKGTLRDQLLDQFLEGQFLMHVRFQRIRAHLANQIAEAQIAREIRAENKSIHE